MKKIQYDREKAVSYAHRWALGRNPRYYDFENLNGDCTNFTSQSLYAGSGVMNPTPTFGWYYYNLNNRAPAWTAVEYLNRFLINNSGVGPVAVDTNPSQVKPGDIAQISFDGIVFSHSTVIVDVGEYSSLSDILVASHSIDSDYRPIDSYPYMSLRFLHITHINVW